MKSTRRLTISGGRAELDELLSRVAADLAEYAEATFGCEGNGASEPRAIITLRVEEDSLVEGTTSELLADWEDTVE